MDTLIAQAKKRLIFIKRRKNHKKKNREKKGERYRKGKTKEEGA